MFLVFLKLFSRFHWILGAPTFLSKPEDSVVNQDSLVKFECNIDALPKPKVTWVLNGKELTNKDAKFEADAKTSLYRLTFAKVLPSNSGTFIVKASNTLGESECTFSLVVNGKLF